MHIHLMSHFVAVQSNFLDMDFKSTIVEKPVIAINIRFNFFLYFVLTSYFILLSFRIFPQRVFLGPISGPAIFLACDMINQQPPGPDLCSYEDFSSPSLVLKRLNSPDNNF